MLNLEDRKLKKAIGLAAIGYGSSVKQKRPYIFVRDLKSYDAGF